MSAKTAIRTLRHTVDFCVVGGGLAGICAAVSAARSGSRVLLMQERPVLGGNASSEIRMWACGAAGRDNRETGIIEEICMENLRRNGTKNYYIWDSILLETVQREPNITLLLNCSCCSAETVDGRIASVTGWQMTTQQWHTVEAPLFADCSGDSILAPLTGAAYRMGREDPAEFGEIAATHSEADRCTMGLSCLLQGRVLDHPVSFTPPAWATKLTPEIISKRTPHIWSEKENFWYLELGGDRDSIADTEQVRDELVALAFGVWDYIKNSGEFARAEYWDLEFLGFLPGKRESRRMVGPVIMTQRDVLDGGRFPDVVGYGGWPLDDHHPGGFFHPGAPNIEVDTPAPYGIPYRCLYSVNVPNLFFAGRNVSMTHCAMSSTRVMATCATLGQAVGTAAGIAREFGLTPDGVFRERIGLLQQRLMEAGCFLPGLRRSLPERTMRAALSCNGPAEHLGNLRNGADRNNRTYGEAEQGATVRRGSTVTYRFSEPWKPGLIHIAFDSDLNRDTLPGSEFERYHSMRANILPDSPVMHLPLTLPRAFTLRGVDADGRELTLLRRTDNCLPVVNVVPDTALSELSLTIEETWLGEPEQVHLFSFDMR